MRCVTLRDGRPIAETEALRLSNHTDNVTSVVRRDYSFVVIVKSVKTFSAACGKEHGVFILTAKMVNIVEKMVLFDFLSDSSLQTYQHYIQMEKFL